jgi:hypothetical protein
MIKKIDNYGETITITVHFCLGLIESIIVIIFAII